jgi:hypothetical protein
MMSDHGLGGLRARYSVAVRNTVPRVQMATSLPFMVFEVHELGVVVDPDSSLLTTLRRYMNSVLEPIFRPIPFILGERSGRRPGESWVVPWESIARVTQAGRYGLVIETAHGVTRTFRFRTRRALQAALAELRARGVGL